MHPIIPAAVYLSVAVRGLIKLQRVAWLTSAPVSAVRGWLGKDK